MPSARDVVVSAAESGCVDVVVERYQRVVESFEEADEPSAGTVEYEHDTSSFPAAVELHTPDRVTLLTSARNGST
jgi:hypothetical protein